MAEKIPQLDILLEILNILSKKTLDQATALPRELYKSIQPKGTGEIYIRCRP